MLKHFEFLADSSQDPRNDFMEKLIEVVPDTGTIMVYNASFEKSRIKECAQHEPRFQPWVDAVLERFVDLLKPFNSFSYYHPDQHGSASIKRDQHSLIKVNTQQSRLVRWFELRTQSA